MPEPTCPICNKNVETVADHFPFCSKRCRQQDLAKWFGEEYSIPIGANRTERDISSTGKESDEESDQQ